MLGLSHPRVLLAVLAATMPSQVSSCLTCCAEPLPDGTCCCVHPGCPAIPPSCPPPTKATCGKCWNASGAGGGGWGVAAPAPPPALRPCPTQPSPDAPTYVPVINLTKCAGGCADLPQCASVTKGGVCLQKCSFPQFPADTGRRLMAWVGANVDDPANRDTLGGMAAVVHQLRTNPGLFGGLYGYCGYAWKADGTIYNYNQTSLGQCSGTINQTTTPIPGGADMLGECRRQNMDFQPVVTLKDPQAAIRCGRRRDCH